MVSPAALDSRAERWVMASCTYMKPAGAVGGPELGRPWAEAIGWSGRSGQTNQPNQACSNQVEWIL
jgi:hypothetical protein